MIPGRPPAASGVGAVFAAVGQRGGAGGAAEETVEILRGGEAALGGDVGDLVVGAGEQIARAAQAQFVAQFDEGLAGGGLDDVGGARDGQAGRRLRWARSASASRCRFGCRRWCCCAGSAARRVCRS